MRRHHPRPSTHPSVNIHASAFSEFLGSVPRVAVTLDPVPCDPQQALWIKVTDARPTAGGFVRLAVRTDTVLVPVAVVGSEETAPLLARIDAFSAFLAEGLPWFPLTPTFPLLGPLGLLPLPARWRIRIGEPINAKDIVKDEGDAVAVNALATAVRDRLQRDVTDLVEQRGGAFF